MSHTDFQEISVTNTSCYVCGIGSTGLGNKKCSPTFGGDLIETMPLIEAFNALYMTKNTFKGCLTIFKNGGNKNMKFTLDFE